MSAIVDFDYYSNVFHGTEAEETDFPALYARAADVVGMITRWRVNEDNFDSFPVAVRGLVKKALCYQADYFAINGESVASETGGGFTVGRVSVQPRSGAQNGGLNSISVAPMTFSLLEQTGLLNPQIPCGNDIGGI